MRDVHPRSTPVLVSIVVLVVTVAGAAIVGLRANSERDNRAAPSITDLTINDLTIPAGATRAGTLREVERQSGITVAIPWLPEGLEVTGARTTVACVPTCTHSAQFNVSGPGLAGFGLEQFDRPASNSAGIAVPGAPPGFAFYRGEDQPGFARWTLTTDSATYSLTAGPAAALDTATVLRILLGMAGHNP